jgi:site-specific recombinase XerD
MTNALATNNANALIAQDATALDQNPCVVYLGKLATRSRKTMHGALEVIANILTNRRTCALEVQWGMLRFQHTALVRSQLAERFKADYANLCLAALRGVLKAAWQLQQMSNEDYARACDLERIKGKTEPRGRALNPGEIGALFDACAQDRTPAGARDATLLALLRLGLRRAEIAGIELADWNPNTGALIVHGKGNKERTAYIENGARAALDDWLAIRGDAPGALLCPVNQRGEIEQRALTTQAIYNALAKRAEQAGVCDVSPHDLRRTFVSDLLDAGADIATVQKLAGHANVTTTARYDRRPEEAKRKAVGLLHVPYRSRATV